MVCMDLDAVIPCSFTIQLELNWFELSLTLQYLVDFHTAKGASELQDLFADGMLLLLTDVDIEGWASMFAF